MRVYNANTTDFRNNGIKYIQPMKAVVYEQDNGDYYLDLEVNIKYAEWLVQDNIVVVETNRGKQGFRLNNPKINNNKLIFKAWHLFYDADNYQIASSTVISQSGSAAMLQVKSDTIPSSNPFIVSSDITNTGDDAFTLVSLSDAFFSLVNTYGGHLDRSMFKVGLKSQIGSDKHIVIALGKNLTVFNKEENWDDVVTQLIPVGYNDTMLDATSLISSIQYDIPYCKTVRFEPSEGVDNTNIAAVKADLLEQATKYINEHSYPKISYTIEATTQEVAVGDTVHIKHPKVSCDLSTTVLATTYNCMTGKIETITFGDYVSGARSTVQTKVVQEIKNNQSMIRKTDERITIAVKNLQKKTEASIEVLEDEIELKVDANGIISAINMSPETIAILASKIKLEGITTINGKFKINLDGSAELTDGKITITGTKGTVTIFDGGLLYDYDGFIFKVEAGQIYLNDGSYWTQLSAYSMDTWNVYASNILRCKGYDVITRGDYDSYCAKKDHNHDSLYAPYSHSHGEYASYNHGHSEYAMREALQYYATVGHSHSQYATSSELSALASRVSALE